MTHTYQITGMTCAGCVAKVKHHLLGIEGITNAEVKLDAPQATITMDKHIPVETLQSALRKAGSYHITEVDVQMHHAAPVEEDTEETSWLETYRPILVIFGYITIIAAIAGTSTTGFDWMVGMRVFMSGFFLTFSFFKMLDLSGFADSYSSYDIIARRFRSWGYIYAFIELALGIAYAINFNPIITNTVTLVVMSVSIIGVLRSVLNKRRIQCACLGTVFQLPMSTVTIIEDALMIAMSAAMLIMLA